MLRESFIHIPGVGQKTEVRLWQQGIRSWQDALRARKSLGQRAPAMDRIRQFIRQSQTQYNARNILYFLKHLPNSEAWRLYPDFADKIAFLDIETTGLSVSYDEITVIGLYDLRQACLFVRGQNLDQFPPILERYSILVTFNGSRFDLPFIRATFPAIKLPPVHLDLRFLLRRLGLTGGLKRIEEHLQISRPKQIQGVDGYEATVLWNRYLRGDTFALRVLLEYNLADIINLKKLLDYVYSHLSKRLVPSLQARLPASRLRISKPQIVTKPPAPPEEMVSQGRRAFEILLQKLSRPTGYPVVVGIDLTGSERRPSGWACLNGCEVTATRLASDDDLITRTVACRPDLVSIDSPLSIPEGRHCTSDRCWCRRRYGIARHCERELWRRGVRVYPCLLPSMQALTKRGMRIAKQLGSRGIQVIESYPGAAQDILRISRKKTSVEDLRAGLGDLGLNGDFLEGPVSHDELDAVTCALVGYFFIAQSYEPVGTRHEGYLIIPQKINEIAKGPSNAPSRCSRPTAAMLPRAHQFAGS